MPFYYTKPNSCIKSSVPPSWLKIIGESQRL